MADGSTEHAKQRLIDLYQEMYELTQPECASNCPLPQTCCSPEYCWMAKEVAKDWGEDVSPLQQRDDGLLFMGPQGCVLPPHLRPHCTMHTCDINAVGCKMRPKPDPEWTERYFRLRSEIEELEWSVHHGDEEET